MDITNLDTSRFPEVVRAVEIGEPWPVGALSGNGLQLVIRSIFNVLIDEYFQELKGVEIKDSLQELFVEYVAAAIQRSSQGDDPPMMPSLGQLAGALDGITFTVKYFQALQGGADLAGELQQ